MTRSLVHGLLTAVSLLALSLPSCPKPASPDHRHTGTPGPRARTQPEAKRYRVRFDHPLKPGQRYRVELHGNVDNETTIEGQPAAARTDRWSYVFLAEATVKAVHACGKATREEHRILKLQHTRGGTTTDLLPAGTVVLAEAVGTKEKFTVKGKPVSAQAAKVLGFVVALFDGDVITTDDMFGTPVPQKPGDTWTLNKVKLLASLRHKLKDTSLWPRLSDVTGKVTLVSVKRVKGRDMLEYKAEARLENIAPKMGAVKATAGTLDLVVSGRVPLDPKLASAGTMRMSLTMHVEGEFMRAGKVIKMTVNVLQAQRGTKTALP